MNMNPSSPPSTSFALEHPSPSSIDRLARDPPALIGSPPSAGVGGDDSVAECISTSRPRPCATPLELASSAAEAERPEAEEGESVERSDDSAACMRGLAAAPTSADVADGGEERRAAGPSAKRGDVPVRGLCESCGPCERECDISSEADGAGKGGDCLVRAGGGGILRIGARVGGGEGERSRA